MILPALHFKQKLKLTFHSHELKLFSNVQCPSYDNIANQHFPIAAFFNLTCCIVYLSISQFYQVSSVDGKYAKIYWELRWSATMRTDALKWDWIFEHSRWFLYLKRIERIACWFLKLNILGAICRTRRLVRFFCELLAEKMQSNLSFPLPNVFPKQNLRVFCCLGDCWNYSCLFAVGALSRKWKRSCDTKRQNSSESVRYLWAGRLLRGALWSQVRRLTGLQ